MRRPLAALGAAFALLAGFLIAAPAAQSGTGITTGQYGAYQVFDIAPSARGTSSIPNCTAGVPNTFTGTVKSPSAPYSPAKRGVVELGTNYLMFVDVSATYPSAPWGLTMFNAAGQELRYLSGAWVTEPAGGWTASYKIFSGAGQIYGVASNGFMYVTPGAANSSAPTYPVHTQSWAIRTYFSNDRAMAAGDPVSITPDLTYNTCTNSTIYDEAALTADWAVGSNLANYATPSSPINPTVAAQFANQVTYPPQPPTNVVAVKEYDTDLGQDVIRVSWDAPADQGTLPVSHYAVYGGPEWGSPSNPLKLAGCMTDSTAKSLTSCVVSSPGLLYAVQLGANVFFVKAFNGLGWSGAASSNMLDIQPDLSPPSAARNVKAVGGWNKITVSWEKPEKGGGYPITNYLASSDPGRKFCITTAKSYSGGAVDANALECVFTNLTPGTNYTFEAQALNGNGWGDRSAASNAATPWNLKVNAYSRKWTFLKLNQEVTVKGVGPGLPAGHRIGVEWRFPKGSAEGEWKSAGSVGNGATGAFEWKRKMPQGVDKKARVAVRFTALDPITGERHESNTVLIAPVK